MRRQCTGDLIFNVTGFVPLAELICSVEHYILPWNRLAAGLGTQLYSSYFYK
jgi:hypothetical protein